LVVAAVGDVDVAGGVHRHAVGTLELPDLIRSLLDRRSTATDRRHAAHQAWHTEKQAAAREREQAREQHIRRNRDRSSDYGIEL
jgi:hypothetical protein